MTISYPVQDYKITSGYGARDTGIPGASIDHKGIDFAVPIGTIVSAAAAGTVSKVGTDKVSGNYMILDHGGGLQTIYRHLSAFLSEQGAAVASGQPIAKSGNTGISSGPHLHFETIVNGQAQDPLRLLRGSMTKNNSGSEAESIPDMATKVIELFYQYWYIAVGGMIGIALLMPRRRA